MCRPEIRRPNRRLDYGSGFYTTTSYEQAERWVQRKMKESKTNKGFVMQTRMQEDFEHDYDIVYGPVANDRVYAALPFMKGICSGSRLSLKNLRQ